MIESILLRLLDNLSSVADYQLVKRQLSEETCESHVPQLFLGTQGALEATFDAACSELDSTERAENEDLKNSVLDWVNLAKHSFESTFF